MHFVRDLYTVVIVFSYAIASYANNVVFPCTTPNEESANCISIFSCPGLMKSLGTLEPAAIKYFNESLCLDCRAGDVMVCCGRADLVRVDPPKKALPVISPSEPISTYTIESKRENALRNLIPARSYCGFQQTDDRYYNDTVTALDEFPWLVHIKFSAKNKFEDRCTGVLINNRHVLTAMLCAFPAIKVRLGQYDVSRKVTCLTNPQAPDCSEGTIEINVENKIHLLKTGHVKLALSLLRLSDEVQYSDFVRPICLPLTETHNPSAKKPLIFSGWGSKPKGNAEDDAIKKRLLYDMSPKEPCTNGKPKVKRLFSDYPGSVFCISPQKTNIDSACFGDNGGPLMYSNNKHQWFVEYIVVEVLYDTNKCENTNALAAKVTPQIIESILDNIEP